MFFLLLRNFPALQYILGPSEQQRELKLIHVDQQFSSETLTAFEICIDESDGLKMLFMKSQLINYRVQLN